MSLNNSTRDGDNNGDGKGNVVAKSKALKLKSEFGTATISHQGPGSVMLGALFGAGGSGSLHLKAPSSSSSSSLHNNLATDRRAVLDLFSLYPKAVKIVWTYDATEFCCNADTGRCCFVTNDLDAFIHHAAGTSRCECCGRHVHCGTSSSSSQKDESFTCDKCKSTAAIADELSTSNDNNNKNNCNNNNNVLLDMTVGKNSSNNKSNNPPSSSFSSSSYNNSIATTIDLVIKNNRPDYDDDNSDALLPQSSKHMPTNRRGRSSAPKKSRKLVKKTSQSASPAVCSSAANAKPPSLSRPVLPVPELSSSLSHDGSSSFLFSSGGKIDNNNSNNDVNNDDGSSMMMMDEQRDELFANRNCSALGSDEELVECNHCGRLLRKESLRTHIARRHENARHHTCQFCEYQSYDAYVMREHVRRHLGQYLFKCDLCPFQAVKKYQLDSHMRRHTGEKPFRCTLCAYACAWNVQLKSHMPLHEQGTDEERMARTCSTCGVLFSSLGQFNRHPCVRGPNQRSPSPAAAPKSKKQPRTGEQAPKKQRQAPPPPTSEQPAAASHSQQQLPADTSSSASVVLRKRSFRVPLVSSDPSAIAQSTGGGDAWSSPLSLLLPPSHEASSDQPQDLTGGLSPSIAAAADPQKSSIFQQSSVPGFTSFLPFTTSIMGSTSTSGVFDATGACPANNLKQEQVE